MRKLQRKELRLVVGGASSSATCLNSTTGHEYTVSCSGGNSCTSADYVGCSCSGGGSTTLCDTAFA